MRQEKKGKGRKMIPNNCTKYYNDQRSTHAENDK